MNYYHNGIINSILEKLPSSDADAWIICDYKDSNPAFRFFFSDIRVSRRAFFVISQDEAPFVVAHRVDYNRFKGYKILPYSGYDDLLRIIKDIRARYNKVLVDYSGLGGASPLSSIDAGTLHLLEAAGFSIKTSEELHQHVFARWNPDDVAAHKKASIVYFDALQGSFQYIRENLGKVTEGDVVNYLDERTRREGIEICVPCVAVNRNSSFPSYSRVGAGATINERDWLFVDCHAHIPGEVFSDITWVAHVGGRPPEAYERAFAAVRDARNLAVDLVQEAFAQGRRIEGWEVDRAVRTFFSMTGQDKYFAHRLGHSLGKTIHGVGANLDDLETHDTRPLIKGTAFTIEPGLYYEDFGLRTEINVIIGENGPEVVTPMQNDIHII